MEVRGAQGETKIRETQTQNASNICGHSRVVCYRDDVKGPNAHVKVLAVGAHSGALPPPEAPEELTTGSASVGELGPEVLPTAFTQCVCSQRSISHKQCITLSRP